MSQGSYIYSDDMSYEDYINQTGGYSRYADKGNVFVMKVDGSAWKLSQGSFLSRKKVKQREAIRSEDQDD